MSTKHFHWHGDAAKALEGERYLEGAPIEYVIFDQPLLAIQAWHGLTAARRTAITARLVAAGWIEGEQSKPDVAVG